MIQFKLLQLTSVHNTQLLSFFTGLFCVCLLFSFLFKIFSMILYFPVVRLFLRVCLWYIRGQSSVGAVYIAPTSCWTEVFAVSNLSESNLVPFFRLRRCGDQGMVVSGYGRTVLVYITVADCLHNIRSAYLPDFWTMSFSLPCFIAVQTSREIIVHFSIVCADRRQMWQYLAYL